MNMRAWGRSSATATSSRRCTSRASCSWSRASARCSSRSSSSSACSASSCCSSATWCCRGSRWCSLLIVIKRCSCSACALVLSVLQRLLPRRAAPRRDRAAGALLLGADRVPDPFVPDDADRVRRRDPAAANLLAQPARALRRCFRDVLYDLRFPPLWRPRATSRCGRSALLLVGLLGVRQARPPPRRGGVTVGAAIVVDDVSKRFRLYHERNQSLKAAVMRGRRARYEEFDALNDVSFEVPEGSTFGLIGENGSGKSTLLKCIARILRPERGRDHEHGQDLRAARARRGLPPRALRARERLPQRRDPRHVEEAARRALRRDRRLRRPRATSSTRR